VTLKKVIRDYVDGSPIKYAKNLEEKSIIYTWNWR